MSENKVIKKEKREFNWFGLILAIILIIALGVGAFFISRWIISNTNKEQPTEVDDGKETNDRLLQLLNDNITKTKVGDETLATEVTSFSFSGNHFYISGFNGNTVYSYDVNLSAQSFTTTKQALDYVKANDVEKTFDINLRRCTPVDSEEFTNKYVTEGVSGRYHIGQLGAKKYVYATLLKGEQITVINGDELSDVLLQTYSPTLVNSSDSLYNSYKYLTSK